MKNCNSKEYTNEELFRGLRQFAIELVQRDVRGAATLVELIEEVRLENLPDAHLAATSTALDHDVNFGGIA